MPKGVGYGKGQKPGKKGKGKGKAFGGKKAAPFKKGGKK